MEIFNIADLKNRKAADALILPFWKEKKGAEAAFPVKEFSSLITPPIKSHDFSGNQGELFYVYSKGKEKRIILLGLGEEKQVSCEGLRLAYAHAVKALRKLKAEKISVFIPETKALNSETVCRGIAEGMFLTNYSFDLMKGETKKNSPPLLKQLFFIGLDKKEFALCQKQLKIIKIVYQTRDLVNGSADDVTPTLLASKAKELAKEFSSIKTTVFDRTRIEKEKLGLLYAVSRGATTEPAFILIEYRGNPHSKEMTALVGKGITFDTGGLNIKTANMETMHEDMSGAAVVLGVIRAAALIGLKINLLGVIPSTENAVGPKSYKPGNIYRSYSGITVEVADTDAEGRLVLADAISYAQDKYPALTRIIDIATLTGGVVVALGEETTGLFSNNDALAKQLIAAGETTYERVWRMPIFSEYKEMLKSKVADIKNSGGGRTASPIKGAIFIHHFVKDNTPWAHLDIAGTAYPSEQKPYHSSRATGVGVRLLMEFLENLK